MPNKSSSKKNTFKPSISDDAVQAKTGRTWPEWFAVLDKAGAKKMSHKEIVAYLHQKHGVGDWWQQMVTVTYEQARGLRAVHEKEGGFAASASKTIGAPVQKLFEAWNDEKVRARWLPDAAFTVRKATPGKSLRILWSDGISQVNVNLYDKGAAKSQVAIDQTRLKSARQVAKMKKLWGEALERLKALLEAKS
jgi:uncharacterized protein YndB with AHSA1/START domain